MYTANTVANPIPHFPEKWRFILGAQITSSWLFRLNRLNSESFRLVFRTFSCRRSKILDIQKESERTTFINGRFSSFSICALSPNSDRFDFSPWRVIPSISIYREVATWRRIRRSTTLGARSIYAPTFWLFVAPVPKRRFFFPHRGRPETKIGLVIEDKFNHSWRAYRLAAEALALYKHARRRRRRHSIVASVSKRGGTSR